MSDAVERDDDSANNDLDLCDEDYPPGITCAKCGIRCSLEYYCSKDAGVQCFEHYCADCIDSHGCEGEEQPPQCKSSWNSTAKSLSESKTYLAWTLHKSRHQVQRFMTESLRLQKAQTRFYKRAKEAFPIGSRVRFWYGGINGREFVGVVEAYDVDGLAIRFPEDLPVPAHMRVCKPDGIGFVCWSEIGGSVSDG